MNWKDKLKNSLNILRPSQIEMYFSNGRMNIKADGYDFCHRSTDATIVCWVWVDKSDASIETDNIKLSYSLHPKSWYNVAIKIINGNSTLFINGKEVFEDSNSNGLVFNCYYSTISNLTFYEEISKNNIGSIYRVTKKK